MKLTTRLYSLIAMALLLLPLAVSAQPMDTSHKVDTLSFWDRLSVRTNGTDWLLMVPNVGVEFDLRNTNWNRYAINLNLRYRPGASTVKVSPFVGELTEIKVEGRMYWRERQAEADGPLMYHTYPWDKLMSCRKMVAKHPNTVFYRGVYASYGTGAFRATGYGHRGDFVQFGITWGFVKPLYSFANGNSIDMEIGVSGGLAVVKSEEFDVDYNNNQYVTTEKKGWHMLKYPVINDLHAALVYRLGKYDIRKKYRWRYDVDMEYHDRIRDAWLARQSRQIQKYKNDSIYKVVATDFREIYDSVINVRHKERQEMIDKSAPTRKQYIKVEREEVESGRTSIQDIIKSYATKKN